MEEEEIQISTDFTFLLKGMVVPTLLLWIVILWLTVVNDMLLISYLIGFCMVLNILLLLITHGMSIKKVFVNYSTEEFVIRSFNGREEKIPFKELVGYRMQYPRTVKLRFTGHRKRYFRRPLSSEFKSKSFVKEKLSEILSNNSR